ncbi:MAG: pyridoxamine 5'-phosphate oxidase family protein [Solobacterium sp.]|jgi:nitroimidazol reductase NimA-like FMN-containing flavoprotein (pyridoxamine 5'-phosphate oxidase superfamily)|nr:pyridoxamine 5'-phosphate oxidase family protein [Solobacterium sp.]
MYPKMRRFKQQMTDEACIRVLESERRGVLAVCGSDGQPYAIPLNFYYEDGKIYFHGAKAGHKIDIIRENPKVSFNVYTHGIPSEIKRGVDVESVTVFGTIREMENSETAVSFLRKLGLKYFPDDQEYIENEVNSTRAAVQMLELTIDQMTGKNVNES